MRPPRKQKTLQLDDEQLDEEMVDIDIDEDGENGDVQADDQPFKFMCVNLGQGDCTLIRCPDGRIGMIDCGSVAGTGSSASQKAKSIYKGISDQLIAWSGDYIYPNTDPPKNNRNVIDFLILTHCDQDHYNKLLKVFPKKSRVVIKKVYFSGGPNSVGEDSLYRQSEIYAVPNVKDGQISMSNYKVGKIGNKILDRTWSTEEAIEVVVNREMTRYYTYDLTKNNDQKGNRNAQYGQESIIDANEGTLEIVEGDSPGIGPWSIKLIAGNVLKLKFPPASRSSAQPEKKIAKTTNADNDLIKVLPPYTESKTKNTASLCTLFSFSGEGNSDDENCILLMGDATNLTFDYLSKQPHVEWSHLNCLLSNVPHHGSSLECNDGRSDLSDVIMGPIPEPNFLFGFIQDKLKPQSAISSTQPDSTMFSLPKELATNNFFETVNKFEDDDVHLLDVWQKAVGATAKQAVQTIRDSWPNGTYTVRYKKKKKKSDPDVEIWATLKTVPDDPDQIPDQGLAWKISTLNGLLLRRIKTNVDVKTISQNGVGDADKFRYILRQFPEPIDND